MRLASCSRNKKATRKKESEEIPIDTKAVDCTVFF